MTARYDVAAVGNAIVDVIAPATDGFLDSEGLAKGSMALIDHARAAALYDRMAPGVETSGGSAANTTVGIASFGGRAAFMGKVASDQLGEVFAHDIRAAGVAFSTPYLDCGPATGRCLVNVTPDGQRTMSTFLGAANRLSPADVDAETVRSAAVTFLEGYLFDPEDARRAFVKAAGLARDAGQTIALTLSDAYVVDRWRDELLAFLDQVDVLFANDVEIASLFQSDFDTATSAVRERVRIAAVTRSERGSVVLCGGDVHVVSAEPVAAVVDSTGAGDQYAAGFLYGLANGRPLPECGRLGSIAAAEVIGHYGPRPQTDLKVLARSAGL